MGIFTSLSWAQRAPRYQSLSWRLTAVHCCILLNLITAIHCIHFPQCILENVDLSVPVHISVQTLGSNGLGSNSVHTMYGTDHHWLSVLNTTNIIVIKWTQGSDLPDKSPRGYKFELNNERNPSDPLFKHKASDKWSTSHCMGSLYCLYCSAFWSCSLLQRTPLHLFPAIQSLSYSSTSHCDALAA